MSAMEDLTKALQENTAIQTKVLAALTAGGAKAAAAAPKAETAKKAEQPKPEPAKKATTVDEVAAAFGGYLNVADKAEREARKANVSAIVGYFGVAKATLIPAASFDEALGYLKTYEAGGVPEFAGAPDEPAEDESLI